VNVQSRGSVRRAMRDVSAVDNVCGLISFVTASRTVHLARTKTTSSAVSQRLAVLQLRRDICK